MTLAKQQMLDSMFGTVDPMCLAEADDGCLCALGSGHAGDHSADNTYTAPHVWPRGA